MKFVTEEIARIQKEMTSLVMHIPEEIFSAKPNPSKWSKKEILGHLIDSAQHNLVRFTEAQYLPEPYLHRPYNQDALVLINNYQQADSEDLLVLWLGLNTRISYIIESASEAVLERKVILPDGSQANLEFLMTDYVKHLQSHLNQIK
ncbi:DinB family protein [Flavobacterium silvaticum]|uniref:DinB family protein n=1 Tax=Flavobacterium silvaticum TaxID=1852020 RepID=A0A972FWN6_9FLAO|nr:DinB family protein [Flavobacterium silvaticum]NMH29015.1 DinB family protein [Flavobacterium silvaticum]